MSDADSGRDLPGVEWIPGMAPATDWDGLRVLSLGGGTQSCALALMSAAGDLPKLDAIVFADTQGELPETYSYLDYLRSVVEPAGIPLHIVTAGNLEAALLGERMTVNPAPPAHLLRLDGKKGRVGAYKCSYDFKRRQVERQVKALCGPRGAWKKTTVEQWIGFSQDEIGRMKQADDCRCGHKRLGMDRQGKALRIHDPACSRCSCQGFDPWLVNRWPLIGLGMKRGDTIRWFAQHGHPTPPRSACWFCPNSGNERWQSLRIGHPDLFERACVIDDTIRSVKDFKDHDAVEGLDGVPFLHSSLVPLRDADIRTETQVRADRGEVSLFDDDVLAGDCDAGTCFT